jgi:hypothetical protein
MNMFGKNVDKHSIRGKESEELSLQLKVGALAVTQPEKSRERDIALRPG